MIKKKEKIKEKKQRESSERTANKIHELMMVLEIFNDEDIENLKRAKGSMQNQNSRLRTVGGLLVDLDKADYQRKVNELRTERTNAILTLLENRGKDWKLAGEHLKELKNKQKIEKMFGL